MVREPPYSLLVLRETSRTEQLVAFGVQLDGPPLYPRVLKGVLYDQSRPIGAVHRDQSTSCGDERHIVRARGGPCLALIRLDVIELGLICLVWIN